MQKEILNNLNALEKKEQIKILYACESGSRAWGFPSTDSDYDVRFIYIREKEWYLRVDHESCRDVVEQPINDLLDINGWDLKKALKLLRKSNPALIEWLNSPIIYRKNNSFTAGLIKLIPLCYSPRACYYHYSHMASRNNREFLRGDIVKVKKYFYVLRPVLAMQWIEQNKGIVPVEFEVLVNELVKNAPLKSAIQKLLADKQKGFESEFVPRIEVISDFIDSELERFKNKGELPLESYCDFAPLNQFFLDVLNGLYH